jgi:hypothetical protein
MIIKSGIKIALLSLAKYFGFGLVGFTGVSRFIK